MKYHHATVHGESIADEEYACTWCDDTFERHPSAMTNGDNQFCSSDCMGSWIEHEQPREETPHWDGGEDTFRCTWCDDTFERYSNSNTDSENNFCSTECFGDWLSSRDMEDHPQWSGGDPEVNCHRCGKTVTRRRSVLEERKRIFCSTVCQAKWRSENWTAEQVPMYQSVEISCETCAGTVERSPSRLERNENHFCSSRCYSQWLSDHNVGEDHPNWRGGHQKYYGPTWHEQRRKALERDGYECQDCGLTREKQREAYGKDLEIHHVTPIRTFNDTAKANQLDNLITLCTDCHIEREHSAENRGFA